MNEIQKYQYYLNCALIDIKNIMANRTLLKGHFSLVAKRHNIKVKDLLKILKGGEYIK